MIDPFHVKQFSRLNPYRLAYTAWARGHEWLARRRYASYALPFDGGASTQSTNGAVADTAVTPEQYACLFEALGEVNDSQGTCIVEVGAYRGVTTRFLAENSSLPIFAVDPFMGYGGSDADYAAFCANTAGLGVTHLKATSGAAAAAWKGRNIGLLFIDALHDYVNTSFDLFAWTRHMANGGLIALHDVDQLCFAGTRKAAYRLGQRSSLFRHVPNLAIFRWDARAAPVNKLA